jgi:hypothetical protein
VSFFVMKSCLNGLEKLISKLTSKLTSILTTKTHFKTHFETHHQNSLQNSRRFFLSNSQQQKKRIYAHELQAHAFP